MKRKIVRLMEKRDRLQSLIAQCEAQIREEQLKEKQCKEKRDDGGCDKTEILIEASFDAERVYNVNVSVGDNVKRGDTLFVLEAMKMEIPIVASRDGTVVQVNAFVGDKVCKDDVLAVIYGSITRTEPCKGIKKRKRLLKFFDDNYDTVTRSARGFCR